MRLYLTLTAPSWNTEVPRAQEHARNLEMSAAMRIVADMLANSDCRQSEIKHGDVVGSFKISQSPKGAR